MTPQKSKVAVATLGCRVNQYDSEGILNSFAEHGFQVVKSKEEADIIVVNTCSVTSAAEGKGRRMIRHLAKENPNAFLVVTGCYAQRDSNALAKIPEIGLICGNGEKENIVSLTVKAMAEKQLQVAVGDIMLNHCFNGSDHTVTEHNRARAYVKIQDGCEAFCTYCIVPYVRGPVVSRHYEDIIAEGKALDAKGFSEIVLSGIHTGTYNDEGKILFDVVSGLLRETRLKRIRISSLEPMEITDELIRLMAAEPRLCPYLHIPLQSGDDDILQAMNRHYTAADYLALVAKIKEKVPNVAISADIMVGFPGETEAAFENSCKTANKAGLAFLHCFPYSQRPGTKAAEMDNQIPKDIKENRQHRLLHLGAKLKKAYGRQFIGDTVEVLLEQEKNGFIMGHTANFLTVYVENNGSLNSGEFVDVRLLKEENGELYGEVQNSHGC